MFGIGHSVYGGNSAASDVSVLCGSCVGRVYMCTSVQCILPPLFTSSPADSPQNDDSILSQIVHGEFVIFVSLVKSESEESIFLCRS